MTTLIKSTLLAASLVIAGLVASAHVTSAANSSVAAGAGEAEIVEISHAESREGHVWGKSAKRYPWNKNTGAERVGAQSQYGDICAPGQALEKARTMGLRGARVVGVDRRVIKVSGLLDGDQTAANFANGRGCPVVASR